MSPDLPYFCSPRQAFPIPLRFWPASSYRRSHRIGTLTTASDASQTHLYSIQPPSTFSIERQ